MEIMLSDIIDKNIAHENYNEYLIDARKKISVDESRSQISSRSEYFCYVRESVLKKLCAADLLLPEGYNLCLKEGYRSKERQEKSFQNVLMKYQETYKDKSVKEILKMVSAYVAPIEVAGHPTGGAVDVVLLKNGKEIWMGTNFNDEPSETENKTFLHNESINEEARKNRKILIQVMQMNGFINYPAEWWHWSYGDKYWAYVNRCPSYYLPVSEKEIAEMNDHRKNKKVE